ncbi:MAG: ABC transporter permease subunit [Aestuariivirga sp.]|uniref:ABC transporter permease subunit n=1 Tax=Aestuariivirga sp. TaxID=2650926 RepID=UPI0025BA1B1F|nr:ABC transporter permease subunit [Aestuariivirga sp.]MCA3561659.1 ABC transporter permease subunit [Aestuariivirga sp.]
MIAYRPSRAPAYAALAFLVVALTAGFLPVLGMGLEQGLSGLDPYVFRVLRFTLLQAGLSTLLSLALGLPLARALARQSSFPGRGLLLQLLNLPLALPAIVVIIGVIEVYGARGWLGGLFDIYGLQGILLAHVFFNVPLAARLILSDLERIPAESWKLSAQLGLGPRAIWRLVEWPAVRSGVAGAALLVFLLCASSFAVVLTLGGGPRATTLEVAIYQSLRSDFDPQRASMLALVQLALCATLALIAQAWGGLAAGWPMLRLQPKRYDGRSMTSRLLDGGIVALAILLLLPPLVALAGAGLFHINPSALLLRALATSIGLGAASAALAFAVVWPLAVLAVRSGAWRKVATIAVLASWIVPPAALATGWFISLIAYAGMTGLAAFLVIAMNALMSLPFVARVLMPALAQSAEGHDRLCMSLGLSGWSRFRLVELPVVKRAIGLSLVMALILSLGDLTAISLFGTQDFVTLPALIYRQMGSYRFDEAIGTALVLSALVLAFSTLARRWSGRQ